MHQDMCVPWVSRSSPHQHCWHEHDSIVLQSMLSGHTEHRNVHCMHVHVYIYSKRTMVQHRSDQRGRFLAAVSSGGSVFVCSALMSTGFTVLGHTGRLHYMYIQKHTA